MGQGDIISRIDELAAKLKQSLPVGDRMEKERCNSRRLRNSRDFQVCKKFQKVGVLGVQRLLTSNQVERTTKQGLA